MEQGNKQLSIRQIKLVRWFLEKRKKLIKVLIGILLAINLVIWGLMIFQSILFLFPKESHQQMLIELVKERINYLKFHDYFGPKDTEILLQTSVQNLNLRAGDNKITYDFVALIENPNSNWRIDKIEYRFRWIGGQTEIYQEFILPEEKKYLTVFNQKIGSKPYSPKFEIVSQKWKRVRNDQKEILKVLDQIKTENIKLEYAVPVGQTKAVPKLNFEVNNESIYNFRKLPLKMVFLRGIQIVALNELVLDSIESESVKSLELFFNNTLPGFTQIKVLIDLNILDPEIFYR